MTHQQGPATTGAKGAQIAAARQHLTPLGLAWQAHQDQALRMGHHHGGTLGHQLNGATALRLQLLAPTAGIPDLRSGLAAQFSGALQQQFPLPVTTHVGK